MSIKPLSLMLLGSLLTLAGVPAQAAVTVDYVNRDSKEHVFPAVCSGSRSSITFRSNTTGAATLQGSAPCIVQTADEEVTLNGGEDVEIRDGKIEIQ